jgi:hypothetical protein
MTTFYQSPHAGVYNYLYYNTGTYLTPVWVNVTCARDVTMGDEKNMAEAAIRGDGGYNAKIDALRTLSFSFEGLWYPSDTSFIGLTAKYQAMPSTAFEMVCLDGSTATQSGAQGLRMTGVLGKWIRKEPIDGVNTFDAEFHRTISAVTTSWYSQQT